MRSSPRPPRTSKQRGRPLAGRNTNPPPKRPACGRTSAPREQPVGGDSTGRQKPGRGPSGRARSLRGQRAARSLDGRRARGSARREGSKGGGAGTPGPGHRGRAGSGIAEGRPTDCHSHLGKQRPPSTHRGCRARTRAARLPKLPLPHVQRPGRRPDVTASCACAKCSGYAGSCSLGGMSGAPKGSAGQAWDRQVTAECDLG